LINVPALYFTGPYFKPCPIDRLPEDFLLFFSDPTGNCQDSSSNYARAYAVLTHSTLYRILQHPSIGCRYTVSVVTQSNLQSLFKFEMGDFH